MNPSLIKTQQGLYRTIGGLTLDAIVTEIAEILYQEVVAKPGLTKSADAARFLQLSLACEKSECFAALFLDSQHRVLKFEKLFKGTIDGAAVYPRIVLQTGLACNAAAVIFAHNHPSHYCEPSEADRRITQRLKEVLGQVDIRVLDHFVVGKSGWVSMADRGLM